MAKGSAKGQWVFLPAAAPAKWTQKGGKAGGKTGKSTAHTVDAARMDKINKIDADLKVWVGGLSSTTTWKNLQDHFKDVVKPSNTVIMGKGTGVLTFKTAEDASMAISSFGGSELDGKEIQVDVWTKSEKSEKTSTQKKGASKSAKANHVINTTFAKKSLKPTAKALPVNDKMKEKIKAVDDTCKAWVGGLPADATWKQLKDHFMLYGSEVVLCSITRPGVACVTFKTAEDAESAIMSANGTELEGKEIQVDAWTKPEGSEKVKTGKKGSAQPAKNGKGVAKKSLKPTAKAVATSKAAPLSDKWKEKIKAVDNTCKAWVGGLPADATWKQLKEHFTELGCEVSLCAITKPGVACITFKTAEEADSAIAAANATQLGGKEIQVDTWAWSDKKRK